MTIQQKTRWDFIGLSTDSKPTADDAKVTDGSTFYEADTSKLYFWTKGEWYEKQATGGGGGGGTTGTGIITLSSNEFNYSASSGDPDSVALWLLPNGFYILPADYTAVPVVGCLDGSNSSRFNNDIKDNYFKAFVKMDNYFWFFTDKSNQDGSLYTNRPLWVCSIGRDGWFGSDSSYQLKTRSE